MLCDSCRYIIGIELYVATGGIINSTTVWNFFPLYFMHREQCVESYTFLLTLVICNVCIKYLTALLVYLHLLKRAHVASVNASLRDKYSYISTQKQPSYEERMWSSKALMKKLLAKSMVNKPRNGWNYVTF